ncbi:NAD-dependent succinate-semialdehyde dehydrogenase [Pseudomonas sp. GD03842]|uniref:NAD-dependent succinate-semialdehyde dehydrogenase n=1 Tax=Pseudomonas sp. GD03842 TaxID=2975385 RepID=UPI0024498AD7|nr:NAD-dependent succinate-semialdehyde dehydrogenase [Pseudomonas sp. GD03842]MDH0745133.1 NAD-dependent succinate-semialdehyde dehydrogenase [Pseudomonas sp. GD03842]
MDYSQYIAGKFCTGTANAAITVINPATGNVLGSYPQASDTDVKRAIAAAAAALKTWRDTSALERSNMLRRSAALMRQRSDEIAKHISLELGKPFSEAKKEVVVAAEMFEWSAEEARRLYGRVIPARTPGVTQTVVLEPCGVVAAFAGWNAPAITPSRKIAGALAAGCTVVLKPSEETPGVALMIAQATADAGIPAGVINMVFGDPARIADILCTAPEIASISFTGATTVGKEIGGKAGALLKRTTLELGGHAPVIICDDVNVANVAASAAAAKFRNAGQVCISPTRFLVQRPIFDEFVDAFTRAARAFKVGDPFDADTQMGPLKNERRRSAVERLIEDARLRGLRIAAGGERLPGNGYYFQPTVIIEPQMDANVANIEPFGPVALISPFDKLDEAIIEANRLPFGLAAYAFTNNLAAAGKLSHMLQSGAICINEWLASLPETPFGGYKDSGLGSEGGIEGLREFLRVKSVRQSQAS